MAISFVGSKTFTHAATSAQSCSLTDLLDSSGASATLLEGDLVIINYGLGTTVDRTQAQMLASGYTAIHTDLYQNDSNDANQQVQYKFMGASPDASVSIPASNATTAGCAVTIHAFRGVNPVTPLDVTAVTTGGINTGVANAAAITPQTPGTWILACAVAGVAAGAVFTNPAGMSGTTNHFRSATITSTTNDCNVGTAIYTGWTSGSYDPAAFGGSTSTNTGSWTAVTIALRPYIVATGTVSASESGSDTAALAGGVLINGTLAASESGSDSASLAGTVSDSGITGTLAASESGADTAAMTGDVLVSGTLAASESGADTAAMTGDVPVSGTLAASESGADTAAMTGDVLVSGTLAASESGADTTAMTGDVLVSGTLAASESGADTAAMTGDVLVSGTLAASESGADTASFLGDGATAPVTGALAASETGSDSASLAGAVAIRGGLAASESGSDSAGFAGLILIQGGLNASETGSDSAALSSAEIIAPRRSTVGISTATPSKRAAAVSSGRRGPQVSSGTRVPPVSTGVR
jgi:hypothetical protein